jgi:hypothetical protein
MNNYAFLGMVVQGRFRPLATERDTAESFRLTSMPIQSGQPPEDGELRMEDYEGSAILVRGMDDGDWIYSAIVVESASYILTAVVQQAFAPGKKRTQQRLKYPLTGIK